MRAGASGRSTFAGIDVARRRPRLRDAAGWATTRREEQSRLERYFPVRDRDWASEQSEFAWTERCINLRRAALRGNAYPSFLVDVTGPGVGRIVGEAGVDRVDRRSRTGEISMWAAGDLATTRVLRWALAAVLLRAFTASRSLLRAVAPLPALDQERAATVDDLGFWHELTLSGHRRHADPASDSKIFVLHNSVESRELLRERCGR